MYIDTKSSFALDGIVKRFEVALRSFVADKFLAAIPSASEFCNVLTDTATNFEGSNFLSAARYKSKVGNLKSKHTDVYNQMASSRLAYTTRTYPGDSPYVSTVVDIFVLLFDKCFNSKNILSNFASTEELLFGVNSYHRLRNSLSHPGSDEILIEDAVLVLKFVKKLSESIDDSYFWYATKNEVLQLIVDFPTISTISDIRVQNLDRIPLQHKKLFCREDELVHLKDLIFGRQDYQRVSGSVIVYGYGGVGKTALVIEFLYRSIASIKDCNNLQEIDFILFYSSKEEYLRKMDTTGEVYIESVERQISSFADLYNFFCRDLSISNPSDVVKEYRRGIVVIDNVENLLAEDRRLLFAFIKSVPRTVQFILTSRSEEQCEDKIHIEEYRDLSKGRRFINEYLDFEDYPLKLSSNEADSLLAASKGNTLILVQALNTVMNGINTVAQIVDSLGPVRTKDSRIVADFMYKNTFDSAIFEMEKKGYAIRDVIIVISLFKEAIDLYSIGKLCALDIGSATEICQYLCRWLILVKIGETYTLNEFANNFIFIKMLPDRVQLQKKLDEISDYKKRTAAHLNSLDEKTQAKTAIREVMEDWKPKNYVERVVIAECFTSFKEVRPAIQRGDKGRCERLVREFDDHALITDHPYVQYQRAQVLSRLAKSGLFRQRRDEFARSITRAYEDCLESIEFAYPHVRGTRSHGAVLIFFGAHLLGLSIIERAIRNLEEAERIIHQPTTKLFFDVRYYLAKCYQQMLKDGSNLEYKSALQRTIAAVLEQEGVANQMNFDIHKFKSNFSNPNKTRLSEGESPASRDRRR